MSLQARTGLFFIIVGLFSLILYDASVKNGHSIVQLLLIGLASTALGYFLWHRGREKPNGANRFRTIRKLISKKKE